MASKTLSKSEIKTLNKKILDIYEEELFTKKDFVQIINEPKKHVTLNKEAIIFFHEHEPVPLLKFLMKKPILKKITVDMGAVKFVCNGADIMRPGITKIDEDIKENEYVMIIDEKNNAPLAVGKTLYGAEKMNELNDGKVIENLHYVTDELWNL